MLKEDSAQDYAEEVRTIVAYKREAESGARDRMLTNMRNYDCYHLKQDFSHKKTGQSVEFLPKQAMAVEQITSFVHQGLVDLGDWFSVDPQPGNKKPLVSRDEARLLLDRQLDKTSFLTFMEDALKNGLLSATMIAKVHGRTVEKPTFFTEKDSSGAIQLKRRKNRVWELRIELVRNRDYFPDPTADRLYEIQTIEMDLWQLRKLAKDNPGVYDEAAIDACVSEANTLDKKVRERETNQSPAESSYRKRIIIDECWGTIIAEDGTVLHENVVCAIANGTHMIRPPMPNPNWHGKSPFVVAPILRVPHSVHHKALMDAPTQLNQALNELYNLILDAGIMGVFGVRQVREDWIDNADEMSNGIAPGFVAKANASCPPGAKVLETVSTSVLGTESLQVLNITNGELNAAALSNDLRQGVLPSRAVKATEVVESSQSITSVFTGVAKAIESAFIEKLLDLSWLTMWQNADDWDTDEVKALLGDKRAEEIMKLSAEERFAQSVNGHAFKVFGITETLNKIKDFRKLTSFLQTVSGSPVLMEEASKRYDMSKVIVEIAKSLDINEDRIKLDEADETMNAMGSAGGADGGSGMAVNGLPDANSQATQMSATSPEASISAIPQTHFSGRAFNGG